MKKFERDPMVGSFDTDLLRRYSSPVGGKAPIERRRRVVWNPQNYMENSLWKHVKKFESDPTVGSRDTDLLTRYSSRVGGLAPTGRYRRVVPIPRYSIEKNLRILVKKI